MSQAPVVGASRGAGANSTQRCACCARASSQSDEEEDDLEEVGGDEKPRYSRRDRATAVRYSPDRWPSQLPPTGGRVRSHALGDMGDSEEEGDEVRGAQGGGRLHPCLQYSASTLTWALPSHCELQPQFMLRHPNELHALTPCLLLHPQEGGYAPRSGPANELFSQRYSVRERKTVDRFAAPLPRTASGAGAARDGAPFQTAARKRGREDRGRLGGEEEGEEEEEEAQLPHGGGTERYTFRDRALVTIKPAQPQARRDDRCAKVPSFNMHSPCLPICTTTETPATPAPSCPRYHGGGGGGQHDRKRARGERRHGGGGGRRGRGSQRSGRWSGDDEDLPDQPSHAWRAAMVREAGPHRPEADQLLISSAAQNLSSGAGYKHSSSLRSAFF